MTHKLSDLYPLQVDINIDNPNGTFKNDNNLGPIVPNPQKGTPYEKTWLRDIWGFLEYLLNLAGIVPDSSEENINNSQYFEALNTLFLRVLNGNTDFQNGYFIRTRSILDLFPFQYYHFDGVDSNIQIPHNVGLNIDTRDFAIVGVFRTNADFTANPGYIINKRSAFNPGLQISVYTSNKLLAFVDEGSATSAVNTNDVVNDGNFHAYCLNADRGGNMELWLDGVKQDDTASMTGNLFDNTEPLEFGADVSGAKHFEGDIGRHIFFNRKLTESEAKEFSANPLKPIDSKDQGGSNISQNVSTCVNSGSAPYDSFSGASSTGFTASHTTTGTQIAGTVDEISFVKGRVYVVFFTLTLISGTAPLARVQTELGGSIISSEGQYLTESGNNFLIFTTTETTIGVFQLFNTANASFSISNLTICQIGAFAYYQNQDFSNVLMRDSSGNGYHGENNGVALINKSEQLTEISKIITVSLTPDSGTITLNPSSNTLFEVKTGSKVTVTGNVTVDSVSSPTGALTLQGLTHTCGTSDQNAKRSEFNIIFTSLAVTPDGQPRCFIREGNKVLDIWDYGNITTPAVNNFSNHIGAGTFMTISGFYFTDE